MCRGYSLVLVVPHLKLGVYRVDVDMTIDDVLAFVRSVSIGAK